MASIRKFALGAVGLSGMFLCHLPAAAPPDAGSAPTAYAVDFNHPPRHYVITNQGRWELWLEKELAADHPVLASNATWRLRRNLDLLFERIPPHTHALLARRKIFLMLGEQSSLGGKDNGADYFQKNAPNHYPQLDPRMANSILIYSATNYVWLPDLWALKVLAHEFAHAWHLEQWPEKEPDILLTYQNAMDLGLYRNVARQDGRILPAAYAAANQLEYFAELSCMFFAECDYAPTNRHQLARYDPLGHAMIRKMWDVPGSQDH